MGEVGGERGEFSHGRRVGSNESHDLRLCGVRGIQESGANPSYREAKLPDLEVGCRDAGSGRFA